MYLEGCVYTSGDMQAGFWVVFESEDVLKIRKTAMAAITTADLITVNLPEPQKLDLEANRTYL